MPSLKSAGPNGNLTVSIRRCPKFLVLAPKFQEKLLFNANHMTRG
jgi:hypothetical protein